MERGYLLECIDGLAELSNIQLMWTAIIQENKQIGSCSHRALEQKSLNACMGKNWPNFLRKSDIGLKAFHPYRRQHGIARLPSQPDNPVQRYVYGVDNTGIFVQRDLGCHPQAFLACQNFSRCAGIGLGEIHTSHSDWGKTSTIQFRPPSVQDFSGIHKPSFD